MRWRAAILTGTLTFAALIAGATDATFYLGEWALHLPDDRTGWLGVKSSPAGIKADLLWISGSVLPLDSATVSNEEFTLTRIKEVDGKPVGGKLAKIRVTETITLTPGADGLKCVSITPKPDGKGEDRIVFTGKKLPPMPPAPDLSLVKFGEPVQLFNGTTLQGWRLTVTNAANGWGVRSGILYNDPKPTPGKHYGNLRTEAQFEDFSLHAEVRVGKGENSGIYLRGIYEVQVYDTFGKPRDPHNMGAIYSRITPEVSAEKPAGEWQTLDITLVDRHVTVLLNGTKIINNQPVYGPTGGALWPEVDRPGPIYLQGDHTGIEYRDLVLRPVIAR